MVTALTNQCGLCSCRTDYKYYSLILLLSWLGMRGKASRWTLQSFQHDKMMSSVMSFAWWRLAAHNAVNSIQLTHWASPESLLFQPDSLFHFHINLASMFCKTVETTYAGKVLWAEDIYVLFTTLICKWGQMSCVVEFSMSFVNH